MDQKSPSTFPTTTSSSSRSSSQQHEHQQNPLVNKTPKQILTPKEFKAFVLEGKTFISVHTDEIVEGVSAVMEVASEVVPDEVKAVFVVLNILLKKVQEAKSNKEQCRYLTTRAQSIVPYLEKIDETRLKTEHSLHQALEEFKHCLEACVEQVSKFGKKNWIHRALQSGVDAEKFNELNTHLGNAIAALTLGVALQVVSVQTTVEQARQRDQEAMNARVDEIFIQQRQALKAQQAEQGDHLRLDRKEQEKTVSLNLQASLVQLSEKLDLNVEAQRQFLEDNFKKLHLELESEQLLQNQSKKDYVSAKKQFPPELLIAFNNITIHEVINKGSFATVYQGRWCYRAVALKLIESTELTDYQQFVREVEIMSRLRHPNITQLYGACLDPQLCLVMELMLGGSLETKINTNGPLIESVCCQIAQDVAIGLLYLHQRDIYHRDLKTANILMDANGQAKLADFGLSKIHDNNVKTAGVMPFNKEWVAPEVLRAERIAALKGITHRKSVASAASDIYSFGLVLWSMLSGNKPLTNVNNDQEKYDQIIKGEINLAVNRSISDFVQALIFDCCATEFSDRPDIEEVIERLFQWQQTLNPNPLATKQMVYSAPIFAQVELESPRTLCRVGREHEKNQHYEQAVQCFQKAADQKSLDGLYKLGQSFFSGKGCPKDNTKGFQYTQEAAKQGHSPAMFNLGNAYEKGWGCQPDQVKAAFWYKKVVSESNDSSIKKNAQDRLSHMHKQ